MVGGASTHTTHNPCTKCGGVRDAPIECHGCARPWGYTETAYDHEGYPYPVLAGPAPYCDNCEHRAPDFSRCGWCGLRGGHPQEECTVANDYQANLMEDER